MIQNKGSTIKRFIIKEKQTCIKLMFSTNSKGRAVRKSQSEPLRWENDSVVGGEYARKKEIRWEVIQIILES